VADLWGSPAIEALRLGALRACDSEDAANVNAWLDGDDRKFLLRCLRPASGDGPGAARAFLSDGYKIIDNLDVLLAVLDGVRQASAPVQVDGCDLTERRMYVRVICEQVRSSPRRCWPGTAARSPARPARTTRSCSPGSRSPTPRPGAARSP
jgi:hypothetical protein